MIITNTLIVLLLIAIVLSPFIIVGYLLWRLREPLQNTFEKTANIIETVTDAFDDFQNCSLFSPGSCLDFGRGLRDIYEAI